MSHHAHDVRLMSCLIGGIFHGFAIERHRRVLLPPRTVPGIERPIQRVAEGRLFKLFDIPLFLLLLCSR